ncbi:hypothetical protein [Microbacterium esteraromaticum]|uniref:hypothetical protein n=1 Tax=Microbacterium esteraromaticum TaxID=57043 RepID=UPI00195ECC5E|nr:hypothetical protein [Microbacterium esteraromaticum]MBM7464848.1 hypothetical protein [Microbacterium esteraromaticum]
MSLMERTRELGAHDAHVEERTVAAARAALMREISHGAPARGRRRMPRWTGLGIGSLVAGAAVTAIVIGSVLAPPTAQSASAAQVLNAAADVTIRAGDIAVPAGEYLLIRSSSEGVRYWDADMPVKPGEEWMRFNNGNRADAEAALLTMGVRSLYVPADRSAEWISVNEPSPAAEALGDRAREALADAATEPDQLQRETLRLAGGTQEIRDGQDGEGTVTQYLDGRRFWADMPSTEPRELLAWMRARVGESADSIASDSSIVETLVDDPSLPLAPPEVRAAVLRTLAILDGSSVRSVDGDVTTIRFEWSTKWWTAWRDIALDTERGLIVGVTDSGALTGEESAIGGLPDWQRRETYEVSVVDAAP